MLKKILNPVTSTLFIILIIASFLRLYNLTELPPGLYPDEAMNGNNAREALDTGNYKIFYSENFGREGLFIDIQSLFIRQFGNLPWALRLPSALFGIGTVLGIYFLALALYQNEQLALFAAFLLATSFWHVLFSRIGFRAIAAPFFLVWGVYLFLRASRINGKQWLSITGGLLLGLGFYTYIAYRVVPLLMMAAWYLLWKNAGQNQRLQMMPRLVLYTGAAVLTALPIGIYFIHNPADFFGRTAGISVFHSPTPLRDLGWNIIKTAGMFNIAGDFNWRQNFAGKPELFFPVGILFLWGIYLAFKKISRDKLLAVPELVLVSWFLLAALPVVISNEGIPHALRSLLMIPPVFLFAASGGMDAYGWLRRTVTPTRARPIMCLFFAALILEVFIFYFIAWANHPAVKDAFDYRDYVIARRINALPINQIKYVMVPNTSGIIRRDYPISLQTILFLTDTFGMEKRAAKNIHYLSPEQVKLLKPEMGSVVLFL